MSTATTRPSGPGAAIDHGLVPSTFSRPPQGAIAGLALVVRTATQPSCAARRVQYIAVPEWVEFRTPTTPTPWVRARPTAVLWARSVSTCPMPSRPSSRTSGPVSESTAGSVRADMAPDRSRATYQGSRSTPWDWWPHRSACTRLSATRAASSSGTPAATSTLVLKLRNDPADRRGTGPPLDRAPSSVYIVVYSETRGRRCSAWWCRWRSGRAGARSSSPAWRPTGRPRYGTSRAACGSTSARWTATRTASSCTSSTPTPRRSPPTRPPRTSPGGGPSPTGCSSARSTRRGRCSSPTPPRSPHDQPARSAVDGPPTRGDRALRPRQRGRDDPVRRQVEHRGQPGHDRHDGVLARHRHPAALAQRGGERPRVRGRGDGGDRGRRVRPGRRAGDVGAGRRPALLPQPRRGHDDDLLDLRRARCHAHGHRHW